MICKVFALEAGLVLIVTTEAREILIVTYYIIRHIFLHKCRKQIIQYCWEQYNF